MKGNLYEYWIVNPLDGRLDLYTRDLDEFKERASQIDPEKYTFKTNVIRGLTTDTHRIRVIQMLTYAPKRDLSQPIDKNHIRPHLTIVYHDGPERYIGTGLIDWMHTRPGRLPVDDDHVTWSSRCIRHPGYPITLHLGRYRE